MIHDVGRLVARGADAARLFVVDSEADDGPVVSRTDEADVGLEWRTNLQD